MRLASLWFALAGCAPVGPDLPEGPSGGRDVPSDTGKARIVDVADRNPGRFALGDVDGDGSVDIVVSAPDDSRGGPDGGALLVFPGTLTGVVDGSAARAHLLGALDDVQIGRRLALSDVDHDGTLDVLALSLSGRLYVWRGPLVGAEDASAYWLRVDDVDDVVALGDVDGDGFSDWAFQVGSTGRLVTARPEPGVHASGDVGTELAGLLPAPAGDVDGDGRDDLLIGTTIERADGSAIAWTSSSSLFPVGDVDEDGHVDALVGGSGDADLRFVPGPLTGDVAGLGIPIDVGITPLRLYAAGAVPDTDGNGHPEALAWASHTVDSRADVYEQERLHVEVIDGTVHARVEKDVQAGAWAAADLDGDGDAELVLGTEYIDGMPPRPTIGIY